MVNPKDAYNTAVATVLDERREQLRFTYTALAKESGINLRTLHRLLHDERPIQMGYFIAIVRALDIDPSQVVAEASSRIPAVVGD